MAGLGELFPTHSTNYQKGVDSEAAVILTIGSRKGTITINYHHYMIKDEDEEMSYEDAIKYLENRTKENLEIYNPETLADVEHIQKIMDFFKDKIVITWTSGAAAPVERMLDIFMERSLMIDKNTIWFRYDQGNSYDERDGAEMLDLQSSSNSLGFQMYRVDGILYNQMLFYIEAAKNRNLTVKISFEEVEGGFEKLFADLGWPMTDEMANWNNENAGNREIKMYLDGDSNEYLINNSDHDDSSKEVDAADILTIYKEDNAISIDYGNFQEEGEKMTYEEAITYLGNRAEENLLIENFVTLSDVEHIERIINIWRNDILVSGKPETAAPVERLLELYMQRSFVIDRNEISFTYDQGSYDDRDGSEFLYITSKLNPLSCQMIRFDGLLYNQLIYYIKAAKNRSLTIVVILEQFEGGFEKLFADLEWPWTQRMANWNNENEINREIAVNFEGDSSSYCFVSGVHDDE